MVRRNARTGNSGVLFGLIAVGILLLSSAVTGSSLEQGVDMQPKVIQTTAGAFQCNAAPTLLAGRSLLKTGASAILPLQEALHARFGSTLSPVQPESHLPTSQSTSQSTSPFILIGLEQDHPALRNLVSDHKADLPKSGLGPEGYILEITSEHVMIAASKPAGAFYGVTKLLERETASDTGLTIPAGTLVDWPQMGWRGIHLMIGSRAELPDMETILTRYMPQYRLNRLILQVDYHFHYKSHPEVTDGDALTVDDCRRLKELADKSFVQLIPMIDCLGHQSWAQRTGQLLKSHPEFDETPDYPADNKGIYCRSWCPSNPDVNRLVCDLIDELVDAFHANAFHVGMDEVFILGKCDRCKGIPNAKLFARAVNDLHAHIVGKRKLQMLMWADRFLDGKSTGYGEWEASENDTSPAIDMVPKDIVLCDWHYETHYQGAPATYPSVHYFQDKGFRVWPSSWNSEANARMLATCSLQKSTDRMVGYLATTWTGPSTLTRDLSGDPSQSTNRRAAGLVAALRTGSEIAWSGDAGTH